MKHTKMSIALVALFAAAMVVALPASQARADKPINWLTVKVDYTLDTDYFWRGLNLSEYAGEGREQLNHTLAVGAEIDLAELTGSNLGTLSMGAWWEWYADQGVLAGNGSNDHLQEVDYTIAWSMDLSGVEGLGDILTEIKVGWISYQFPGISDSDGDDTNEAYVALSLNDAALWSALGLEDFSVSPVVSYYLDLDDVRGSWIQFDFSYGISLATVGCEEIPVLKDTTVTPAITVGMDHRYFSNSTYFAAVIYRVDVDVDLNSALDIPADYGSFTAGGYIAYNTVINSGLKASSAIATDELFGGFKFSWSY